jgi:protease-4
VLRINSPGGTVSGSDLIYHELLAFKKKHKIPVVACLMGLATSGGYYVAQAADTIVASPTGITGSIGVLAMKPNIKGLMDKVGVDTDLVKTGQWKDFWSPFRPATPAEKEMMQKIINDYYRGFLEVVAQGRKLKPEQVKAWADGRIFTATQAKDLGMVDRLGYLDDAIKLAQEKAGLPEEARVVRYHRPGSYRPNIYSMLPGLDLEMGLGPQFLYLWWPAEPS